MTWRKIAGEFSRPLRIEERDTTVITGSTGQEKDRGWVQVAQTWGRPVPLRASERFVAGQLDARVIVRFELADEISGLTHEMRMIDEQDGACYQITGVLPSTSYGGGQWVDCDRFAD